MGWMVGSVFMMTGLVFVLLVPMVIRSTYAKLPKRLHRSFGIGVWIIGLACATSVPVLLGTGIVFLLGEVDQPLFNSILAATATSYLQWYLLLLAIPAVFMIVGAIIVFIGRMVAYFSNGRRATLQQK